MSSATADPQRLLEEIEALRREQARLETHLAERSRELEAARGDLEAFAYSVSHDLREPLRTIEGFCEMFRGEFADAVPPAGQKLLERIWSGSSRMTQLIDDLLHYSRFTRGALEPGPVRIRELALEVLAQLEEPLRARAAAVQVEALPDCYADAALLGEALRQLLSNALKFSADRADARVTVGALRQGTETVYFVRDNGAGFDMRYADKLFGVFQRMHPADAYPGRGIGLAIVRRIIHRHGGRVWADARPGEGACFYFGLPRAGTPGP